MCPAFPGRLSGPARRISGPRARTRSPEGPLNRRTCSFTASTSRLDCASIYLRGLHEPDHSVRLRAFLEHVDVAYLGCTASGRDGFALGSIRTAASASTRYARALRGESDRLPLRGIIVGGLNTTLLAAVGPAPERPLHGYHVADERVRLGFHPKNPVNLPRRTSRSSCRQACEGSETSPSGSRQARRVWSPRLRRPGRTQPHRASELVRRSGKQWSFAHGGGRSWTC